MGFRIHNARNQGLPALALTAFIGSCYASLCVYGWPWQLGKHCLDRFNPYYAIGPFRFGRDKYRSRFSKRKK